MCIVFLQEQENKEGTTMTHASLTRQWHVLASAIFGVGEGPRCAVRTRRPSSLGAARHRCSWCWRPSSMHLFVIAGQFRRCSRRYWERNSNAERSCWLKGHVEHETFRHEKPCLAPSAFSGCAVAPVRCGLDVFKPDSVMHEHELRVHRRDVHGLALAFFRLRQMQKQCLCQRTKQHQGAASTLVRGPPVCVCLPVQLGQ